MYELGIRVRIRVFQWKFFKFIFCFKQVQLECLISYLSRDMKQEVIDMYLDVREVKGEYIQLVLLVY